MDILKREISRKRQQLEEKELVGVRAVGVEARGGGGAAGTARGGGSGPGRGRGSGLGEGLG